MELPFRGLEFLLRIAMGGGQEVGGHYSRASKEPENHRICFQIILGLGSIKGEKRTFGCESIVALGSPSLGSVHFETINYNFMPASPQMFKSS